MLNLKTLLTKVLDNTNKTTWKLAGTVVGKDQSITVPSNAKAVKIIMVGGCHVESDFVLSTSNIVLLVGGYKLSDSDYGLYNVNNSGFTFSIRNSVYGGYDISSQTRMTIYYKETI